MAKHRLLITAVSATASLALLGISLTSGALPAAADTSGCSPGAHTLAPVGSRMYPETGNGGYTSVHTDVHMVYDASANTFLPGNNVAPASFTFVQPTYPGDPNGQNDPNPLAHEASQLNPVGGPGNNPLPPACSPELPNTKVGADSLDGTQCPANKLVITPQAPIASGSTFTVVVNYTGRPGVHNDGDGTTEGWFAAKGGGFVTTEPVATEDWMPLNDFPTAKPTYDYYD